MHAVVNLTGYAGAEPVFRDAKKGGRFATLAIYTPEYDYKAKKKVRTRHHCTFTQSQSERLENFNVVPGDLVQIIGKLSYANRGDVQYTTILVTEFHLFRISDDHKTPEV